MFLIERVNGEAAKTSDNSRSTTGTRGEVDTAKENSRRRSRERSASRSRSRSPLSNHANSEFDEDNKHRRKIRHSSTSMHEHKDTSNGREHPEKGCKSPIKDLGLNMRKWFGG